MGFKLEGKTAVVTGATGGIGLKIARRLSMEGAKVPFPAARKSALMHASAFPD